MKPFKFRIYDKHNEKMIYSGSTPMMLSSFFKTTATFYTMDGMSYQQYTGMKHGEEVWKEVLRPYDCDK
jgi:hypothetical protein